MLLLLALTIRCQDDEVSRWIEQLSAPEISRRQEAQDQLVKLGRKALTALQEVARSTDPELALRAADTIRLIQKAERRPILQRELNPELLRVRPTILDDATSEVAKTWHGLTAELFGMRWEPSEQVMARCVRKYVDVTRRDFIAIFTSYALGSWKDDEVEGMLFGIAEQTRTQLPPNLAERQMEFVLRGGRVASPEVAEADWQVGDYKGSDALYFEAQKRGRWGELATTAMGNVRDRAVPALIDLLAHEGAEVRTQAIRRLIDWNADESETRLVELLQDPSPKVRGAAITAIRVLALDGAEAKLLNRLGSQDLALRQAVLGCLSELGLPGSVPAFESALDDKDRDVRRWALIGLARSGAGRCEPKVLALLEDADEGVRLEALRTLAILTGFKHASRVRPGLENPASLESASEILGLMGDSDSLPRILARTDDIEPKIREAAIEAVARAHPASIVESWESIDPEAVRPETLWQLNRAVVPELWERVGKMKLAKRKYRGTVSEIASVWSQESGITIEGLEPDRSRYRVHLRPTACFLLDALPMLAPAGYVYRFESPSQVRLIPFEEAMRDTGRWIAQHRK